MDTIFRFIGSVVAYGGGATVLAWLAFRFLGKSWIENVFAMSLEKFRHEQAIELEKLRVEIGAALGKALKVQERELEVLIELWQKIDAAYGRMSAFLSPLQSYPELDGIDPARLEEFLGTTQFFDTQKQAIRDSPSKTKLYRETVFWYEMAEVKSACREFQNYAISKSILIHPVLRKKVDRLIEIMWKALSAKEVGHQSKDLKMENDGWRTLESECRPLYGEIQTEINHRVFDFRSNSDAPE